MKLLQLEECITDLFGRDKLRKPGDEWGFTNKGTDEVAAIGYATNLTPETVREAIDCRVNAIITHHDAWDFIYGMKERCLAALQEHEISHCFFHLPLDDADHATARRPYRVGSSWRTSSGDSSRSEQLSPQNAAAWLRVMKPCHIHQARSLRRARDVLVQPEMDTRAVR